MKTNLRYLNKGFPGKRAQAGFIQNFIIPGIILIGVVIAGIAMLSSGSSTNTSNEKASMLSNAVMAQSLTVTSALQRAEADGAIASTSPQTLTTANLTTALVGGQYIASGSLPVMPSDLTGAGTWSYTKGVLEAKDAQATPADIGSATKDDVLQVALGAVSVGSVAEAVCLRVNNKLYGSPTVSGTTIGGSLGAALVDAPSSAVTGKVGASEGCVSDGTNYVYYKVVNVK